MKTNSLFIFGIAKIRLAPELLDAEPWESQLNLSALLGLVHLITDAPICYTVNAETKVEVIFVSKNIVEKYIAGFGNGGQLRLVDPRG